MAHLLDIARLPDTACLLMACILDIASPPGHGMPPGHGTPLPPLPPLRRVESNRSPYGHGEPQFIHIIRHSRRVYHWALESVVIHRTSTILGRSRIYTAYSKPPSPEQYPIYEAPAHSPMLGHINVPLHPPHSAWGGRHDPDELHMNVQSNYPSKMDFHSCK